MFRGGAGLIAAVLALAGCKATDPKPTDRKEPAGTPAARAKGGGPAWLDESMGKLPGAGTGVPKADSWAHPKDANFNVASEVKGVFAGRVLDTAGQGAKNVFIQIDPADGQPPKAGAELGIWTDANGYFFTKGLKPGQTYTLTARASLDGKSVAGVVQARTPQSNLTIALRDDFGLPPAAGTPPTDGFAPPTRPAPRPADGAWTPGTGSTTAPIPATIGPPPTPTTPAPATPTPTPTLPPPADTRPTPPRPENVADGPVNPFRPPAVSIPGPPVPPLPTLPPSTPPAFPPPKTSRIVRPGANFALVDTLERPWDFATSRSGSLVLLDFMTTTCVPCKRAIPVLAELQSRYAAGGLQLVGVVCDDAPQKDRAALAAKYQREFNLNYALYTEPGPEPGQVRDRYRVESYPTVVLLDGEGGVVWKGHPGERADLESAIRRQLGK